MRSSQILSFQSTAVSSLRRPWQTFKDGQIWYGLTKRGSKRHPLTSKQGNKHFYKGTGSSGYGKLNREGIYMMNWSKVRTYVVPSDLQTTRLKALVSPNVPQIEQKFVGFSDGPKSAELAWKNVVDFIEHGENYNDVDLEQNQYVEETVHPDVTKKLEAESMEGIQT